MIGLHVILSLLSNKALASIIFQRHPRIRVSVLLDYYDPCECRNAGSLISTSIGNIFQQPLLLTCGAANSIIFHRHPSPKLVNGICSNYHAECRRNTFEEYGPLKMLIQLIDTI
jgi:hypothetical protein